MLFVFLAAVAAGTFLGGPLVDRFGAKFVIWGSILGVLPFTLLLPHLGLTGTAIYSIAIGLIISSAFSAIDGLCAGIDARQRRARSRASSSACRSALAASARRCSARSPTAPA